MNSVITILVALLLVVTACNGEDIYSETKDADFWSRTVIMSAERITGTEMAKASQDFLSLIGSRKVAVFSAYTDRRAADSARGIPATCDDYRQWLWYYELSPKVPVAAASMIAINGDAVLRVRTVDGAIVRHIVAGENDPTKFTLDGTEFEILTVGGRKMTVFERCAVPGGIEPVFYIMTAAEPNLDLATKVIARLASILQTDHVTASIGDDYWFPCARFFPLAYPFVQSLAPPTLSSLRRALSFRCRITCDGTPNCSQTSGLPEPGVSPSSGSR